MKKSIHIAFFLALISGCSTQETDLIGTYKSDNPHLVKKAWKFVFEGYRSFITGTELELKRDSSFHMVTCGNILTGKWYSAEDTLYLIYQTNRWKNDSLQKYGFEGKKPEINETPDPLQIRGNELIIHSESSDDNEGMKVYDVLKK